MVNLLSLLANHMIHLICLKSVPQISEETSSNWRAPSTTCRCCCNVDAVFAMCTSIRTLPKPSLWSIFAGFLELCKCRCECTRPFSFFKSKWLIPRMVVPSLLESSFGILCLWPWRRLCRDFARGFWCQMQMELKLTKLVSLSAGNLTQHPPHGLLSVIEVVSCIVHTTPSRPNSPCRSLVRDSQMKSEVA